MKLKISASTGANRASGNAVWRPKASSNVKPDMIKTNLILRIFRAAEDKKKN
jgi:hypothetical protein